VIDLDGTVEAYEAAAATISNPALLAQQALRASVRISRAVSDALAHDAADTSPGRGWRLHNRRTLSLTDPGSPPTEP
jgi:post-segregation antitoxin (ccd killing protein)